MSGKVWEKLEQLREDYPVSIPLRGNERKRLSKKNRGYSLFPSPCGEMSGKEKSPIFPIGKIKTCRFHPLAGK